MQPPPSEVPPMIVDQRVTVAAPPEKVWDFVMDVPPAPPRTKRSGISGGAGPAVSRCVPGTEDVSRLDDDTYAGTLRVKVGPISLRLAGKIIVVERNRDAWQARMDVQAADKRI